MGRMVPVRHVEPRHVHPRIRQLPYHLLRVRRRPDRAHYLRLTPRRRGGELPIGQPQLLLER